MLSVLVDTISLDLSSQVQPVSLLCSELLSPGRAPPMVQDTSVVCHTLSSSIPIAAVDSLVELDQAGNSPTLAAAVPDVGSSTSVSSTSKWNHQPVSPDSVLSDGSFYSATDGTTGQAPVIHYLLLVRLSVGKDLLLRQTPTLGLGTIRGVLPTSSQPTRILILLFPMDSLAYHFITHGSWSGWGLQNMPTYWAGIPANGSGPCPGCKPSTMRDNYNMTPV